MTTALEIKNLHANAADQPILKGINLLIKQGEVHAFTVPTGAQRVGNARPDRGGSAVHRLLQLQHNPRQRRQSDRQGEGAVHPGNALGRQGGATVTHVAPGVVLRV